jgi:hypothetical protein
MTKEHPITPPPELINQWWDEAHQTAKYDEPIGLLVATRSAQWGADRELDGCCEWMKLEGHEHEHAELRAARRPKPKSLKEQALETLKYPKDFWSEAEVDTIRLALEQLDD